MQTRQGVGGAHAGARQERIVDRGGARVNGSSGGNDGVERDLRIGRLDIGLRRTEVRATGAETATTGLSPENVGVGDPRSVAGHRDVQTILEGQLHGILQSDFELAIVDELVNARGIYEIGLINMNRCVGRE